ncbi:D-alanyl-D-alanine carboxypeptidase [Streptomyces subrutilus]|uniref:D-alanyl-D-alanine carboxypeptidase n=1 Tax=Streptomyces subrutilus TaxID=36818 RepID=A0A918QI43_9ACTN|nr:serine hydrolase [Streptomyces subrutilus]GGZ45952.1 D-alanyl-D-alanine carboxypeptidase [Streptomyces subrutilus]
MKAVTVASGSSETPKTEGPEERPEPGTEAEAALGTADADEPDPAADRTPDPDADADTDADGGPDADAKAATEPGSDAGTDADTDPDEPAAASIEPDAAVREPEAKPVAAAGADGSDTPAAPEDTAAEAEAEAVTPAPGPVGDGAETGEGDAEEVEDAQDADATGLLKVPGTAPTAAPDDDATAPEREAESEEGSADRPSAEAGSTAVAPRRAPSWARGEESDAERTSTFVALKPLTTPSPSPAPAPAAHPRAAATATAPAPRPDAPREPAPLAQGGGAQPPLDLLAELTNTAPPPETPRRTAVRRVKIWTPVLLLLAGAVGGAQLLRPLPAPALVSAASAHTLDGQFTIPWPAQGQGAVSVSGAGGVGTFGEQQPVPTASVAKVMTAYVILKGHPLRKGEAGPDIVVDEKAVADGTSEHESRIEDLTTGTKFSQQDLLKMLMIPSGNNVARLLARWDTGSDSEQAFVAKMNAAAQELGMADTTYTDPSGLDAKTVSTAADQLKLAEAVMEDEVFRSVVALPDATIKGLPKPIYNNNGSLLTAPGLSIRGIKTGSSSAAGGTLMWAAYKSVGDETPLVLGTLMDQHVDGPDPDGANSLVLVKANSKKIIEAVRAALASAPVIRKGQTVGHVADGLGGRTPLVATQDVNVVGVPGQQLRLSLGAGKGALPHSAKAGTEVGVLTVGEGSGAKTVPVAVRDALAEPSFTTRLTRLG